MKFLAPKCMLPNKLKLHLETNNCNINLVISTIFTTEKYFLSIRQYQATLTYYKMTYDVAICKNYIPEQKCDSISCYRHDKRNDS